MRKLSVKESWRSVKEALQKALKKVAWLALLNGVLATASLAQGASKAGESHYNVLFIAVDDLKPMLGCYGDSTVLSPNIDRLAEQGTAFQSAYCQQAVCGPSRASLLTGWRPDKTEVWDLKTLIRDRNPNVITLPEYFKQHGYETAAVGKVFDPRSVDDGHDKISWTIPYTRVKNNRWIFAKKRVSTENADAPENRFADFNIEKAGAHLMELLKQKGKPFFLAVGFHKPHLPFVAPKKYWDLYRRDQFRPWPFQKHSKYAPEFAFQPGWELRHYTDIPPKGLVPIPKQLELIHGYHACVSFVDAQIGRLLDALQKEGLEKNTIVILWGDHGWHLGDHAMWCKHSNFEQATRAPLIIAAPNMPQHQKSNALVEFVDVFPTLCDLAGLPVPQNLDGVSLVPILKNAQKTVKPFAVSQFHRIAPHKLKVEGYALRTKRYRYVEWLKNYKFTHVYADSDIVARELYDYQTDPLETVSVADSSAYREVAERLHAQLKAFLKKQAAEIRAMKAETGGKRH